MSWWRSWDLTFDPFVSGAIPFVSTAEHEEAVARLVYQINSGEPRVVIEGEPGSGTSTVMREGLRRLRSPRRRVSLVRSPADEWSMIRGLSLGLGVRIGPRIDRSEALGRVLDSIWLAGKQGFSVILAIDDAKRIDSDSLDELVAVGSQAGGIMTVVSSGHPDDSTSGHCAFDVRVHVRRLTRAMAEVYVGEKVRAAGRIEPILTDRAMLKLHARSEGLPRMIDRLARLSLMAGTLDRLTLLPEEVIDEISREFQEFPDLAITPN